MPLPEILYGPDTSILITGASSGIGEALAFQLASYGGKIALAARRKDKLEEVAGQVRRIGGHPLVLTVDTTDSEGIAQAHETLIREHGPVDVAFLNAGVSERTAFPPFQAKRIRELMEVNFFGVVNWLEAVLPSMLERGKGTIVGVSSLASRRALPGHGGYSASKAALSHLLESLRVMARQRGIQISTVEPGFVRTPMTDKNTFVMPFRMEPESAARLIAARVAAGERVIRFPWALATIVGALRQLPVSLYDRLGPTLIHHQHRSKPD